MSVNNTKTVYKCFEVQKTCETCKHLDMDEVEWNQICIAGNCEVTGDKVRLLNDCESWDFDEKLFKDTFWIVKRKQEDSL